MPIPFRRRITLRRVLTVIVGAFLALLIIAGAIAWFVQKREPPSTADAPWAIQTSSRYYYASKLSILPDGNPQIQDYWEFDNGRYNYMDGTLPFPKTQYGNVNIIRRPRQ